MAKSHPHKDRTDLEPAGIDLLLHKDLPEPDTEAANTGREQPGTAVAVDIAEAAGTAEQAAGTAEQAAYTAVQRVPDTVERPEHTAVQEPEP